MSASDLQCMCTHMDIHTLRILTEASGKGKAVIIPLFCWQNSVLFLKEVLCSFFSPSHIFHCCLHLWKREESVLSAGSKLWDNYELLFGHWEPKPSTWQMQ